MTMGNPEKESVADESATKPIAVIGFAEALAAPEAAWSLVDDGFRVVAFARRGRRSALRHSRLSEVREITSPESNFEASLAELRVILRELDRDERCTPGVLMPLDDASVLLCSTIGLDQSKWCLAGPEGKCAEFALNKNLQTNMASMAGFSVPQTWSLETAEQASSFGRTASFPVILKAAICASLTDGHLQKGGFWICGSLQEFTKAIEQWHGSHQLLVQQFVRGDGEGVFGMATAAGIKAWSAHRRLRMMNPHGSGSSACAAQTVDPEVRTAVERLVSLSGWRGLFMVELLRDISGKLWFVEFNGRPWGSTALSRRQGFEYPSWQARLALRQQIAAECPPIIPGMVCRHVGREIMHVLFVMKGPKSRVLGNWPSFWRTLGQIFRVRIGDRIYNWRRQDPMVFLADCCYTVLDNLVKRKN